MGIAAYIFVECDICGNECDTPGQTCELARYYAKQDGWKKVGYTDYCPDCYDALAASPSPRNGAGKDSE